MSEDKVAAGSLAAYMQEQRQRREKATSRRFTVPGFPALEVELRPVDYKREFRAGKSNQKKVKDDADQLLYTMADTLQLATLGFFAGGKAVTGQDNTWNGLCVSAYPETAAHPLTPRQAMIRLIEPDGVGRLYRDYQDWRESRGEEIGDELEADLGSTH